MSSAGWRVGNRIELLINGEAYFPRVFEAIGQARSEVLVETFILFDDPTGRALREALIAAARRGVRVELTVDGYGSPDLSAEFVGGMVEAGVRFHVYDPQPKVLGMRINIFRRLHRKIVVIDNALAFVGGINFSHDHVREFGPEAKQDYAVEVEGPVVRDIRRLAHQAVTPWRQRATPMHWWWQRALPAPDEARREAGTARALFVVRDNAWHRDDIERHYRDALRAARREIIIANAYFFPGYKFLRDLHNAARRGVRVHLILQGNPDKPSVRWASSTLYDYLLRAGATIHEYCERPLHGKVAVVDEDWATVGSSNLDPLSLFLNLEANLIVRDRAFAGGLRAHLHELIDTQCRQVGQEHTAERALGRRLLTAIAFHVTRRFPRWAGWLPGHRDSDVPPLATQSPPAEPGSTPAAGASPRPSKAA